MRPRVLSTAVPALVAAAILALALTQLYVAHPHEDAYIAFTYVENLAAGHGVVFYPGGPPTEGVTDFLWLLMLAGLVRCGIDVAIAAALLNAIGGGLAAWLFERQLARDGVSGAPAVALAFVPLLLPLLGGAPAAYLGFSAMLFSAATLGLFVMASEASERTLCWIPFVGLVVTLFRPDGAPIGVGFTLIGLWQASRRGCLRPYLASSAIAALGGVAYWVARYAYFGLPLPLPLYVKSQGAMRGPLADRIVAIVPWLRGIGGNLSWLKSPLGPASLLAAGTLLAAITPRAERAAIARLLALLAPFAALFFLLALAFQHQNIHYRFQAPALLAIFFVVFRFAAACLRRADSDARRFAVVAVLWLAVLPPAVAGWEAIGKSLRTRYHTDVFAALLPTVLHPGRSIAVTEAGRIPYWSRARTFDIIGLNNPETARHPASLAYLDTLDPDLVVFNGVYAFDLVSDGTKAYGPLPAAVLAERVKPAYRELFRTGVADSTAITTTDAAPVMLGRYLAEHEDAYEVVVVPYKTTGATGATGAHVIGVRKSLPERAAILAVLETSTSGRRYASYAALKGWR